MAAVIDFILEISFNNSMLVGLGIGVMIILAIASAENWYMRDKFKPGQVWEYKLHGWYCLFEINGPEEFGNYPITIIRGTLASDSFHIDSSVATYSKFIYNNSRLVRILYGK